ncbi:MAG TPA: DUF411 domain-containing protein [Sphingomicrobium sp.]|nr:DUF411 domain-containing protein [Sphingomicrobium sp.]
MIDNGSRLARRAVLGGLVASGALVIAGCGRQDAPQQVRQNAAQPAPAAPRLAAMTVYRDPSCGCCEAWAEIARNAGHPVTVIDHPDMATIKRRHGVPEELASCHTTIVDGYAVEGHVPLAAVARLLEERPAGTSGIAVPGMPRGSPGMEMPDGSSDSFQVIAFDASGKTKVFAAG